MINSGSTTTTLTLPSAADAYVLDGSSADQNFGQTAAMLVKNVGIAGFDRRSFVRFDLTGVAAADQITSAKVRLFGNLLNTAVTGMPIGLYSGREHGLERDRPDVDQPARRRRDAAGDERPSPGRPAPGTSST